MTIDEVLKEFRELLSQYTGEAITGHYNEETQQKMESLFFQAEARGRESVIRMVEDMWVDLEGYSPIQQDEITKYLLTKIKEDSHD